MCNGLVVRCVLSMPRHSVYTEWVFGWDPRKAEANAAKHGVSFDEAVTVFLDPEAFDGPGPAALFGRSTTSAARAIGRRTRAHRCLHDQEKW